MLLKKQTCYLNNKKRKICSVKMQKKSGGRMPFLAIFSYYILDKQEKKMYNDFN